MPENESVMKAMPVAQATFAPGAVIDDKYEIESFLGQGGMCVVFKAKHLQLHRPAAIKVLLAKRLGDANAVERFQREANAVAQLKHRNIVEVYGFGVVDGQPYMAMEFLEGQDLAQILNSKENHRLPIAEARPYFEQICDAVEAAHSAGIFHRDLKPSNVVLEHNVIKLIDFGIAKLSSDGNVVQTLTQTGAILGSIAYMSPEAASGKPFDERSDIYSLGCLMYETLTGEPPFSGDTPYAVIAKHVNEEPNVPPELQNAVGKVILQTLEKDPQKRPRSASELKQLLLHPPSYSRSGQHKRSMPSSRFAKILCVSLIAVGAAWWVFGTLDKPQANQTDIPVREEPAPTSADKRNLELAPIWAEAHATIKKLENERNPTNQQSLGYQIINRLAPLVEHPRSVDTEDSQLKTKLLIAHGYRYAFKHARAEELFDELYVHAKNTTEDAPFIADMAIRSAEAKDHQNKTKEAALRLEEARDVIAPFNSNNVQPKLDIENLLGPIYVKLNRFQEAAKCFEDLLASARNDEQMRCNALAGLGQAHFLSANNSKPRLRQAARELEASVACKLPPNSVIDPYRYQSMRLLAQTYTKLGDAQKAESWRKRSLK